MQEMTIVAENFPNSALNEISIYSPFVDFTGNRDPEARSSLLVLFDDKEELLAETPLSTVVYGIKLLLLFNAVAMGKGI